MEQGRDITQVNRALKLEYFTVAYNVLEAFVAIGCGIWFGSIALEGFGFDSLIETVAAVTLIWRLRHEAHGHSMEEVEKMERRATKIVGFTFFLLAAYILWKAGGDLWHHRAPETSWPGVIIASLSILIMVPLARMKKKIAKIIGSRALAADATETFVCVYLSVILLVGSGLYAAFGWWWVDSVASLGMLYFIIREGWESWTGEDSCSCS